MLYASHSPLAVGRAGVGASEPVPWLPRLAPTVAGRSLRPASSAAQFSRAVRAVGESAAQWAVEVGRDVADRVAGEIPGHIADGGYDVLRMGTESTTLQLLVALAGVEIDSAVTPESLGGIPDFLRRRVSLDELLRGIQLGHSVIASAFLAECDRLGGAEQRHEQMRILSQRMFAFFDAFSTQMAGFYRDEEARYAQSDAASRLALAQEFIRGMDHSADATSRRLGYDIGRTHVALIVWSTARTLDADQQGLYDAARDLLRNAGCAQKLVLSVSLGVVWAWATPNTENGDLAARLAAATLPPSTHAVFGEPGQGAAGFRASHLDAHAAFAVLHSTSSLAGVTAYRDVDLVSLLLADRERGLRFAAAELGALGGEDPGTADLRRTLAVYLDEGGSPNASSLKLSVSRNTVTYRVRRAEQLLGRPLTERRLQLQAALAIFDEAQG